MSFAVVSLNLISSDGEKKVVVPLKWTKGINLTNAAKEGANSAENIVVYFSLNKNETPDFRLGIKSTFDSSKASCYYGTMHRYFSKFHYIRFIFNCCLSCFFCCAIILS